MRKKTLEKRTIDDGYGKDPQEEVVFDTVLLDNNETVHVIEVLPIELEGEHHHHHHNISEEEEEDQSQRNQRIIFVPQNEHEQEGHYESHHSNENSEVDEKHVEFQYHYQSDDNTQSSTEYTNEDGTSIRIISVKKEYKKHEHESGGDEEEVEEEHYDNTETDFTKSTKKYSNHHKVEYLDMDEEEEQGQSYSNRHNVKNKTKNSSSSSKDIEEEDYDTIRIKKLSHNKLEKTRRDDLKACLDQLKALVPLEDNREKFTTVSLLRKTKMLIAKLEEKEKRNYAFKGELMREQNYLRKTLNQLKLENAGISNEDASTSSSTSISGSAVATSSSSSSSSSAPSSSASLSSRLTDSVISQSQNITTTTTAAATTTTTNNTSVITTTPAIMNSSSSSSSPLNNNTNQKPKPVQPVNHGLFSTSLPHSQLLHHHLQLQNNLQVLPPHTKVKTPPILKRRQQLPIISSSPAKIIHLSSPCTTNPSYSSSNTLNTYTNTSTSSANTISTISIENQNPEVVYIEASQLEGETTDASHIVHEGDNDTYIMLSINDWMEKELHTS